MQDQFLVLWHKYNNIEAGMYPLMLSLAACLCLVFAGTGFAQTKHSAPKAAAVLRGSSAAMSAKKVAAKPVAPKASVALRQIGLWLNRRHSSKCAPPATAAS